MHNLDPLRQHYLDAMGISTWLPKTALPGAAPSPEWSWDHGGQDDEQPEAGQLEGAASNTAAASIPSDTENSLDSLPSSPRSESSPVTALKGRPSSEQQRQQAEPVVDQEEARDSIDTVNTTAAKPKTDSDTTVSSPPRFRMAMVVYSDCLVIAQLPMDVLQALAPEHQRLIHRILHSIGFGQSNPETQLFAWPIVNNPNVDQSLPLAQAAIQQLEQRFNTTELPLIVFGEQMLTNLGLPDSLIDKPERVKGRNIIQAPTLNELMSIPGLKRELWIQLQDFQQLLR